MTRSAPLVLGLLLPLLACAREATVAEAPAKPASGADPEGSRTDALPPDLDADADIEVVTLRFVARLDTELGLDDAQATKLREIFHDFALQLQPHVAYVRSKRSTLAKLAAARERRPQIRELRAANDAAIAPVLTPDQFARYVQLRDEFRSALRERFLEGV